MLTGSQSNLRHLLLLPAVVAFIGCGSAEAPPPETYVATGHVLGRDGQPLTGGIIQFIHQQQAALTTSAMIEEDGTFQLTTIHGNQNLAGAIEGEFQVLVTLPIVAGQVPQTVTLPEPVAISPSENRLVIYLP